jgi:anti-sigma B factor antagonist
MPSSNFLVETQCGERATILSVSGELDLLSSPELEQALERVNAGDSELVMLDMRRLEFMDSTGLHTLVKAHQRAHESGRRFVVIKGGEQVQRLLNLTGMSELLTVVDSPDELLDGDHAVREP